jgi:hypothetical protein
VLPWTSRGRELQRLRDQAREFQSRDVALCAENDALRNELGRLQEQARKSLTRDPDMCSENDALRSELARLQEQAVTFVQRDTALCAENEAVRNELVRLRDQASEMERRLTRLQIDDFSNKRLSIRAMAPALRPKQLCFMHIGKTAGTSLHHMLCENLRDLSIYHTSRPGFDNTTPDEIEPYDLILGHFCYRHTSKFRPERFMITVLRDPVDRVVSLYNFLRLWPGQGNALNSVALTAAKALSLREFLLSDHPEILMHISDNQTKTLAFDYLPCELPCRDDLLDMARDHLAAFEFVGICEHFDASVHALSVALRLDEPMVSKRLNVTAEQGEIIAASAADIRLIQDLNELDNELYVNARREFELKYLHNSKANGLLTYPGRVTRGVTNGSADPRRDAVMTEAARSALVTPNGADWPGLDLTSFENSL